MAIQVSGITCAGCEQRAVVVLGRLDSVMEATADRRTGEVTVLTGGGTLDRQQVVARLAAAGFEPVVETSP